VWNSNCIQWQIYHFFCQSDLLGNELAAEENLAERGQAIEIMDH
jgi:hypothetical protein